MALSPVNAGRTCEVCGQPAEIETGTPSGAIISGWRPQHFVCMPHWDAWIKWDHTEQFREAMRGRIFNARRFELWQQEFNAFVAKSNGT